MDSQTSDNIDRFNLEFVREQRLKNKVFGLRQPERWSSHKELLDFLDELFSRKSPLIKMESPVGSRSSILNLS